jgi:hypothetical protein
MPFSWLRDRRAIGEAFGGLRSSIAGGNAYATRVDCQRISKSFHQPSKQGTQSTCRKIEFLGSIHGLRLERS